MLGGGVGGCCAAVCIRGCLVCVCCCCVCPCWVGAGCAAGCVRGCLVWCCCVPAGCIGLLVVMERKEWIIKTSIPTQNIIYTTFKGWLYNIANPLQKEKGKLTKYGCFPFIPYAFKISTSTPILIIKSSTSLSLLVDLMNSNFSFRYVFNSHGTMEICFYILI